MTGVKNRVFCFLTQKYHIVYYLYSVWFESSSRNDFRNIFDRLLVFLMKKKTCYLAENRKEQAVWVK